MHRMGHSTMRAALIYQHATSRRDREIASAMDRRIARRSGKKAAGAGRPAAGRRRTSAQSAELLARQWPQDRPGVWKTKARSRKPPLTWAFVP